MVIWEDGEVRPELGEHCVDVLFGEVGLGQQQVQHALLVLLAVPAAELRFDALLVLEVDLLVLQNGDDLTGRTPTFLTSPLTFSSFSFSTRWPTTGSSLDNFPTPRYLMLII